MEALDALVRPAFDSQLALLRELALTVFKQQLSVGGTPAGGSPRAARSFVDRAQRWAGRVGGQDGWGGRGGRGATASRRLALLLPPPPLVTHTLAAVSARRYTAEALEQFDSQLGEVVVPDTDWDTAAARKHLERDIAAHVHAAR